METAEFVIVGCGPAGATAAREAARAGIDVVVLEKDAVVGAKRVCAAGLRPGFCEEFGVPRSVVHYDTPRMGLFDVDGAEHEIFFGPGHTSTREELDGTLGELARAEGAQICTQALFRDLSIQRDRILVEYVDLRTQERKRLAARAVFLAQGATALLEDTPLAYPLWRNGLMTTLQYRVYIDRPAEPITYRTLEMHYYLASDGRQVVGWMFPKRDHLAIGLGIIGKMEGGRLRAELDAFTARIRERLYASCKVTRVKVEGHLLYMEAPRPALARDAVMVGGTAAGLVDATNGEGIYEAASSGRIAAEALRAHRDRPQRGAARYFKTVRSRFVRRLERRVKLMHFLEARPDRFRILFEQLENTPRLPETLYTDARRTLSDKLWLYAQMARFALAAR